MNQTRPGACRALFLFKLCQFVFAETEINAANAELLFLDGHQEAVTGREH